MDKLNDKTFCLFVTISYILWFAKNVFVFQGKRLEEVTDLAIAYRYDFLAAHSIAVMKTCGASRGTMWSPTSQGQLKLNTNAYV